MRYLLLILTTFSFAASAMDSYEYMQRIESMVKAGAITSEAANQEKKRLKETSGLSLQQRGLAQRDLASVSPELKPLKIKRFKAKPMQLWLE
jgi:hypothetical protein